MMRRFETANEWWRSAAYGSVGLLAVVLLTFIGFHLHLSFTTASFCFLILLVVQSLSGNFVSSGVVAILAVASLDYFFVEPLFSFQVDSPLDTLGLISFVITSLVITKLENKYHPGTELSPRQQCGCRGSMI